MQIANGYHNRYISTIFNYAQHQLISNYIIRPIPTKSLSFVRQNSLSYSQNNKKQKNEKKEPKQNKQL